MEGKGESEIWCDDKFAIAIARNPMHHGRIKHIDIKFDHIQNLISDGIVILKYYNTIEKLANLLTKPLHIKKHNILRTQLGVCNLQPR